MSAISHELASLRADVRQELARLRARAVEGGPFLVVRTGVLLAALPDGEEVEVGPERVAALRALPDGAGGAAAWSVLSAGGGA